MVKTSGNKEILTRSIYLAFYNGLKYGGPFSKLVCIRTLSKWSHVEIVLNKTNKDSLCFAASPDEGRCRFKIIKFDKEKKDKWCLKEIKISEEQYQRILLYCKKQYGKKYDWFGILTFVTGVNSSESNKWFCSEIAAKIMKEFLGYNFDEREARITPKELKDYMDKHK